MQCRLGISHVPLNCVSVLESGILAPESRPDPQLVIARIRNQLPSDVDSTGNGSGEVLLRVRRSVKLTVGGERSSGRMVLGIRQLDRRGFEKPLDGGARGRDRSPRYKSEQIRIADFLGRTCRKPAGPHGGLR
jgi:hypothetical protein